MNIQGHVLFQMIFNVWIEYHLEQHMTWKGMCQVKFIQIRYFYLALEGHDHLFFISVFDKP
jgi:hypothetical protein